MLIGSPTRQSSHAGTSSAIAPQRGGGHVIREDVVTMTLDEQVATSETIGDSPRVSKQGYGSKTPISDFVDLTFQLR